MSFATYPQQLMPGIGNPFIGQQQSAGLPWNAPHVSWTQTTGLVPQNSWAGQTGIGFGGFTTGFPRQTMPAFDSIGGPGAFGIDPVTAIAFQQAALQRLQQLQQVQRVQQLHQLQQLQELQQLAQLQQLQPYAPVWQQPLSQMQPLQPLQTFQPQLVPVAV